MVMHVRSTDRILVLEKEDPKMSAGILDPAVFEGKNNLHLRQDLVTGLWEFKYERGAVPPPLRNPWTSPKFALAHAESYFKTKKIKIKEIKD
jgi:hypothetical protein